MKSFKFLLPLLLCVIFRMDLSAQDSGTRYGIGVNFAKDFVVADVGSDLSVMSLPYDFSNISIVFRSASFRVEPSLGYFRFSSSYSEGSAEAEATTSNWRLGFNLAVNKETGKMHHYYGISVGFIFSSVYSKFSSDLFSDKEDDSKTDFFVGPVLGGEYNFHENLSLGGEIQFNYISLGQYDDSEGDLSVSVITTRAIIVLRWYF